MKFWTLDEIKNKVEDECDLQEETFIRPAELVEYINEAIDECEAEIHGLYEDYFLKYADINVSDGIEVTSLPTDIYANKIRRIIFYQGGVGASTTTYKIKRLSDDRKFEQKATNDSTSSTNLYEYFLINQIIGNPQIMFTPKIRETGVVRVWYLRNANRLANAADVCDIPEFINFIFAYTKVKIYSKEGHPDQQSAEMKLDRQRELMQATLQAMVPDAENNIDMDLSHYEDMNQEFINVFTTRVRQSTLFWNW